MSNFHPLEVAGRGSETQLQVGENLNVYCRGILQYFVFCLQKNGDPSYRLIP